MLEECEANAAPGWIQAGHTKFGESSRHNRCQRAVAVPPASGIYFIFHIDLISHINIIIKLFLLKKRSKYTNIALSTKTNKQIKKIKARVRARVRTRTEPEPELKPEPEPEPEPKQVKARTKFERQRDEGRRRRSRHRQVVVVERREGGDEMKRKTRSH